MPPLAENLLTQILKLSFQLSVFQPQSQNCFFFFVKQKYFEFGEKPQSCLQAATQVGK